jgi:uncharacterized protein (TIGR02001 family)
MRTSYRALAAGLFLFSTAAAAEEASDFTITGAATIASQYRFRGISQSDNKPVVQGAITVAHKSGFYVSTWGSSASAGNSTVNIGGTEIDVYGGWTGPLGKSGVTLDTGAYGYLYPGASGLDYYEIYASLAKTFGPVSAKAGVYYAPDQSAFDAFATQHSAYVYGELSGSIPGTPVTIHGHVGHTGGAFDYTEEYVDYNVGASVKWRALTFDLSLVGTDVSRGDARRAPFPDQAGVPNPSETYRAAKPVVVASLAASF